MLEAFAITIRVASFIAIEMKKSDRLNGARGKLTWLNHEYTIDARIPGVSFLVLARMCKTHIEQMDGNVCVLLMNIRFCILFDGKLLTIEDIN